MPHVSDRTVKVDRNVQAASSENCFYKLLIGFGSFHAGQRHQFNIGMANTEDNFLPCGFSIKGFMQFSLFSLRTGLSISCT